MICSTSLTQLPGFGIKRIAAACGVFDGLHLGHQAIFQTLSMEAQKTDAVPVVITFDPHPDQIVNPKSSPNLLFSREHRIKLLERFQIKVTVVIPFNSDLAQLQPEEFISKMVLIEGLQVTSLCIGENWRFGHQAKGDTALLNLLGQKYKFRVRVVPEVNLNGISTSSTRIRAAVSEGDLELARKILGRRFSILGTVEFGKGIATSDLNSPTANISSDNEVFPPSGVYAAKVCIFSKREKPLLKDGVLYLGKSPTYVKIPPKKPFVEIHIFDFNGEIYGQSIEVEFVRYIREDRKFDSVSELKNQINHDIIKAKDILRATRVSRVI